MIAVYVSVIARWVETVQKKDGMPDGDQGALYCRSWALGIDVFVINAGAA
ncbi:hypothetical protein [Pseudophaeobacter sp.]|jgi:hypothetical protein